MNRLGTAILLAAAALVAGAANPSAPPDLVEASGIAVRAEGKVAIVAGDETPDRLWAVALDDFSKRWDLPFPADIAGMDDVEALAPWGKDGLFIACSQSRTKPRGRTRPARDRLALVTLGPDARTITAGRVYENLRGRLIEHLLREARDALENPAALSEESPKSGGLNVEGLAVWQGRLLVGLRSPAAKGGGAIVIPIRSPEKLFEPGGAEKAPDFGKPLILPAAPGEGIRDLCATDGDVLAVLGPSGEAQTPAPRIVRWNPTTNEIRKVHAKGWEGIAKPEGIALDPQDRLLVVQDQRPPLPQVLFRLELSNP